MRIVYLHGLESMIDKTKPKIKFLKENFTDAFIPSIDYTDENTFGDLYSSIKAMNPDLIIGSSMGGYFGYLIGSKLGIETILFNPAVIGRSFDPIVDDTKLKSIMHNVFLGKTDDVIIGKHVKTYFKEKGTGVFNYEVYEGNHRVPAEIFINAIDSTVSAKK